MRIRRLRLRLPPRLRATAQHDARLIANAVAEQLAGQSGAPPVRQLRLSGDGAPAQALAQRVRALVAGPTRSKG